MQGWKAVDGRMASESGGRALRVALRVLAAGALLFALAGSSAPDAAAAAAKAPRLELVVEPLHPVRGTQAEIVAQVLPTSLGRKGRVSAHMVGPGGTSTSVKIQRVKGATPGTFEGLAPVPRLGSYQVVMRYVGGGRVLTAKRSFQVVNGSPLAHDLSLAIVVVVLGGAWLLMRRRR